MRRFALVIDDNRLIANSLVQMLNLLGYQGEAAYGPLPAMHRMSQRVPDIVLLDLHMQGVNGVDICRYIRRDARLTRVPIIAISSDTQGELVKGVIDAGADIFLPKPVEIETLEKALAGLASSDSTRPLKPYTQPLR